MTKYEQRRLDLLHLVTKMGKGAQVQIARAIDKTPDYISRMLYPKDKPGHKGIGEDTADLLDKAFPGWQSGTKVSEDQPPSIEQKARWPFASISPSQWGQLPSSTKMLIETQILALIKVDLGNKKAA